ncbi:hypothetical protein AH4AK4_1726 [Aeromonas hydrophila 4AK4]|nr:hypothetical protein AH4AK4_1726 [Aeromonas hydrophila 4AK4]
MAGAAPKAMTCKREATASLLHVWKPGFSHGISSRQRTWRPSQDRKEASRLALKPVRDQGNGGH